jgi:hypothetical protein
MAHAGGRPAIPYDEHIAEHVCSLISETTLSLQQLCQKHPELPGLTTLLMWRRTNPEFSTLYFDAKREQVHNYVDETFEMASMCDTDPGSVAKCNMEINLRKWYASRLVPRMYGEKTEVKSDMTIAVHEDRLKDLK